MVSPIINDSKTVIPNHLAQTIRLSCFFIFAIMIRVMEIRDVIRKIGTVMRTVNAKK